MKKLLFLLFIFSVGCTTQQKTITPELKYKSGFKYDSSGRLISITILSGGK